jgi:hypothetical protein
MLFGICQDKVRRPRRPRAEEPAVSRRPVFGDFALRLTRVELAVADQLAKRVLEVVLQFRRPCLLNRAARLRPEVLVVVRAAEGLVQEVEPDRRCVVRPTPCAADGIRFAGHDVQFFAAYVVSLIQKSNLHML